MMALAFTFCIANTPHFDDELNKIKKSIKPILTPLPTVENLNQDGNPPLFREESAPSKRTTIPLVTSIIEIHYAKATEIVKFITNKSFAILSPFGNAYADPRTNTLWVKDNMEKIYAIKKLIHRIDIPVRQVLIKARIVNIDDQYTKSLGVLFQTSKTNRSDKQALAMDLPTSTATLSTINIPIIKFEDNILLNLQLNALEKTGHAKIISSPELMASNRQSADIEAGEEVPFQQQNNNGGTSVAFKKAVLRLQVIPEIMPNQRILLHLTVNQDKVSTLEINGVPAISTRRINTQVLVKNHETFVIGGIFEQAQSEQQQGVPGLQKIPLIGALFRQKNRLHERKQLLIFVTPTIL